MTSTQSVGSLCLLILLASGVAGRRTPTPRRGGWIGEPPPPSTPDGTGNVTRRLSMPCANPTAKAAVTFPASLAGQLKMTNKMYSGYVPPDGPTGDKYLFYWCVMRNET